MKLPQTPPPTDLKGLGVGAMLRVVAAGIPATSPTGQYRHWETMRRMKAPEGLSPEEWWWGTKIARSQLLKELPLRDGAGRNFRLAMTDRLWEMLHEIDTHLGREVGSADRLFNEATRTRYLVSSLVEEAVTSSQLEGAVTSRTVAKEMIRSGRPPRTIDERMVLNNYEAINFVREHRNDPLTPELVVEIQAILTEGTLDDPEHVGRVQIPSEERVRVEDFDGLVVHRPPGAAELPERMQAMCDFANGVTPTGFMHPVARSILLHLWLAYDHPFADGNGRTARALFYWSMLHEGYWLAEYLSISTILRKAPIRYAKSFLYVETDENDATYFVLSQLKVVRRSIDGLYDYIERKRGEIHEVEALLRSHDGLNYRQLALLTHALRHPGHRYSFQGHARSHGVVYQSARTDLLALADLGLLERHKMGKQFVFTAPAALADVLRSD
ncbi:MAG: Fic family protein [Acidobacteria bacterium]|nr:Fic family protein [Acidobacteriota bacterium]